MRTCLGMHVRGAQRARDEFLQQESPSVSLHATGAAS
jgi:hypothetical protein